ncbi:MULTISPECIES: hypothetical protein [Polymorphospora]|uniref:Uncharacterized protein n=1 Tax=Polymorphospora lycopeni TaxID=3140240 RepID=A0ABV5D0X0_9ACTN
MTYQPGLRLPGYYEYYAAPLKMVSTLDGGMAAWRMSIETGDWEPANHLIDKVLFARGGEVDRLSKQEFIELCEETRARYLQGTGPVYALYETRRAITDTVERENRPYTLPERALLAGLSRETYVMFEEELRRAGSPAADPSLGRD